MAAVPLRPIPTSPALPRHETAQSVDLSGSISLPPAESSLGSKIMIRRPPPVIFNSIKRRTMTMVQGVRDPSVLFQELEDGDIQTKSGQMDPFRDLRSRFSSFKHQKYLANPVYYSSLAEAQTPKFMVIACADSRVCPSTVLGFQPGEAFTVRNVANIVPPFQHGPSETSAALEFAVNSLEVPNILVVGHSRCGGIRALMSSSEETNASPLISCETDQSFVSKWISVAKSARVSAKVAAANQCFDTQCQHCEKESIKASLKNLISYPWIKKKVMDGSLSIHGGYYDFVYCTFEKWTMAYNENMDGDLKYGVKDKALWS